MVPTLDESLVILDGHFAEPAQYEVGRGQISVFSRRNPAAQKSNQDALAVAVCQGNRAVLAVADGVGGLPAGDQASGAAIASLVNAIDEAVAAGAELRDGILNGFEQANRSVVALGVGAATTLSVAEIDGTFIRPYHVGDSEIQVVGQRGKIKLQTVSHAPVAYGVEAGLIDPTEALHHEERNLVSNMLGLADMRIEIGSRLEMNPRDTLVVATDGLFDNLAESEVTQIIRKGPLKEAGLKLADQSLARMTEPKPSQPSKPDDVAFILFRRGATPAG